MKIVTDSGTDTNLSPEEMQDLNITVVPLNVTLDGKTYREGLDIEPGQFYDLLDASQNMPTTSQPSAVKSSWRVSTIFLRPGSARPIES